MDVTDTQFQAAVLLGELASLVVAVQLEPGETADNMLTSRAYGGLAKLLEALRAHDARIVEQLDEQQAPSRTSPSRRTPKTRSRAEPVRAALPPRPRRC